jgi:hypothetical protein
MYVKIRMFLTDKYGEVAGAIEPFRAARGSHRHRLGRVDGFDQDKAAGESDGGSVVLGGLLAAQGDAFEAFQLPIVCSMRARPL